MADQGAILVNKIAIKLNGINDPIYALNGFLTGFKAANGIKYVHVVENDVLKSDVKMFQNQISKGYYSEDGFLEYRKTGDISKLGKEYSFFVSAEIGDIINVKKIRLFSPFNFEDFGNWNNYTLIYAGTSLVNDKGEIVEPPIPFSPAIESMNLNGIAINFYKKNIYHVNTAATDIEKYERALSIAKIAIYIHNINVVLFPLFTITELVTLKNNQNTYWQTDVFKNPTYSDITKYFDSIYFFFRGAYLNQKRINEAKGYEKAYWLALGMSSIALQSFVPLNKIALLSWMSQNVRIGQQWLFFNDNEGLILKIIESVTASQSDLFLYALFTLSESYRDNLFDRLSDEKGFLSDNVVDDSTFGIGEDNRYKFIMSLYLIWQNSSYNPYQNGVFSQENLDKFEYNNKLGTNPDKDNSFFENILFLDPNKINFNAKPISLNYTSTSSGGYYIDNFYFRSTNIQGDLNQAHLDNLGTDLDDLDDNFKNAPRNKVLAFQKGYRKNGKDGLYGTYDYLQPVSLINADFDATIKIPLVNGNSNADSDVNNLIPIFVLKYIDDRNLSSNIETTVSYIVDIVSIAAGGYGAISKIKYLRSLSGFTPEIMAGAEASTVFKVSLYASLGAELLSLTAASISLYLKVITDSSNSSDPGIKSLKEFVMWIEVFSGVGSVAAEYKLRSSAKKVVNSFNDNWPIEFTTDPRGVEAKNKLNKIAGVNIAADLVSYSLNALVRLERKFDLDVIYFERNLYSLAYKGDIIELGFNKGLSVDEISGIIHQASRKREVTVAISIQEFENRMVIFLERKRLRCPTTHPTRVEFEAYHDLYIAPAIEKFGLPNYNKTFGGSSITSNTSFSPGPQDTDWTVYWRNKEEFNTFLDKQQALHYKKATIQGKSTPPKRAKDIRRKMEANFKEKGAVLNKNYIISIDDNNNIISLDKYLETFPEQFKTDLTPKLINFNNTSPAILY